MPETVHVLIRWLDDWDNACPHKTIGYLFICLSVLVTYVLMDYGFNRSSSIHPPVLYYKARMYALETTLLHIFSKTTQGAGIDPAPFSCPGLHFIALHKRGDVFEPRCYLFQIVASNVHRKGLNHFSNNQNVSFWRKKFPDPSQVFTLQCIIVLAIGNMEFQLN